MSKQAQFCRRFLEASECYEGSDEAVVSHVLVLGVLHWRLE